MALVPGVHLVPFHLCPSSSYILFLPLSSYIVSVGVVGQISDGFSGVSGPLTQPAQAQLVIASVNLLVAASAALHSR